MITWIQKTFQQHFRIIFFVLLAGVIISFVFITNTAGGFGRSEYKAPKRPFFDLDLSNEQDYSRIMRDGSLSATLLYARRGIDVTQYSYERYAMLHTANQLNVPQATDAELKAYIQSIPIFMAQRSEGDAPRFDADTYNIIRKDPRHLGVSATPADFARVLAEDARIAATSRLIAGPGYVLPSEVQQVLKQFDSTWTLQTATIARDSFKTTITPSDLELTTYFEANRARYTISPRVRVSYAEIAATHFMAGISPTEAEIRAHYDANPARFPKPAAAPESMALPAESTPDNDYAQVKPQVELSLRQQLAIDAAYKAASNLADKLYADKITPDSPDFARILIQNNATINSVPDFSEDEPPARFGNSRYAIAREAFSLSAENRVSHAINTNNGAVILFWQTTIPSREPGFEEVSVKVSEDYIAQENQRQFVALGQKLKTRIQDAIAAGSSFEAAATKAATAEGVTVSAKSIPAFTLRTATYETIDGNIVAALEHLKQGEVSDMSIVSRDGRFVYAQSCELPDLTEGNPNYALFASQIANRKAMEYAGQYRRNLANAERAKTDPTTNR
ncbi:peptidylprolyl isomerase [Ereboglobus luteus]|uniref:PpiC domain-containing protein n=1 Tax=Ereboglobus luteus TaxID=1796921 RepID=A0A2U8E063_9BACT|nr:peptidyl-prolyl cis-trans isomerase [Ereboglobus luteus]AWI08238.1 hypothetical protein CKA38_02235 [Ereboglobus luteus]